MTEAELKRFAGVGGFAKLTKAMNHRPPSIPNDDLIAKCSPRGAGNGGNVVWSGHFASYSPPAPKQVPAPQSVRKPAMAYVMEHWTSTKRNYRAIEGVCVTNLYCGVDKGWDIIIYGTIMHHEKHKTDAQREAEKLLDGQC